MNGKVQKYACPLFKKGETSLICNYRPIAILPVISKLIEKVAHKQLYAFLSTHNILSKSQFGFRPGHSTSAAIGSLTDDWLRFIDIGQIIGAIRAIYIYLLTSRH